MLSGLVPSDRLPVLSDAAQQYQEFARIELAVVGTHDNMVAVRVRQLEPVPPQSLVFSADQLSRKAIDLFAGELPYGVGLSLDVQALAS